MRWKKWIVYGIGVLFIGSAITLFWFWTQNYQVAATTMTTLMPTRLLQVGEEITQDMVRPVVIPKAAHHAEAVLNFEDIRGKTVVVPIGVNEEVLRWKLTDNYIYPKEGERYYSFKTDEIQNVSNMVRQGDRVDVWVEFEQPKRVVDDRGSAIWIGGVKIIENLLVANVKSQEGTEITDSTPVSNVVDSIKLGGNNEQNIRRVRSTPNAKPTMNTYIMDDDTYQAYVLGSLAGHIKLSLPNVFQPAEKVVSKVTEMFNQLRGTDIFDKQSKADVPVHQVYQDQVEVSNANKQNPAGGRP